MSDYDPVECLREEVIRFKDTNRFSPMTVTNFFVQAGLVIEQLDHLRQDNERLKGDRDLLAKELQFRCDESDKQDIEIDELKSTLQRHKSCLEVARGALMAMLEASKGFQRIKAYPKAYESIHQINEVLGDDSKPNPNEPHFNGMETQPGPGHPNPPWQA